ncbi:hypothetical protein OED52_06535 [Rhodococcus sp. Z13]|uniref:Uncharacterized protein n=1 Tax=Rhodococcus sacchari TaxID=2962047 RepID=A0ACD4DJH3_9NOCA|nr:hypothetical protein [Rhodococcus sp. Z13]UYP20192.1 hypothetical protein OED52_06535 [Rhodococcus sp. Z13]
MAQWFEGFDGQFVLDDDYVWIVRQGIPATLLPGNPGSPLRALRSDVVGTEFRPATESGLGFLRIRLALGSKTAAALAGQDVVRFSAVSNDRFSALNLLLGGSSEPATETMAVGDQLRAALDGFDGIATRAELAEVLGAEPDVLHAHEGVTWNSVGTLWVAAGGTGDETPDGRLERIRALDALTRRLPANSGIKALQNAVKSTSLEYLDAQRIGTLWEAVMSEALPDVISVADQTDSPPASQRELTVAAPPKGKTSRRPRTRVWNKWDRQDSMRRSLRDPKPYVDADARTDAANNSMVADTEAVPQRQSTRRINALSGKRVRVFLDCEGHRVKALFDPDTQAMEVTVAPIRVLLGATYPDPNSAAKAVVSTFRLGDDGPFDGWELWRVDDASMKSLGESVNKSST